MKKKGTETDKEMPSWYFLGILLTVAVCVYFINGFNFSNPRPDLEEQARKIQYRYCVPDNSELGVFVNWAYLEPAAGLQEKYDKECEEMKAYAVKKWAEYCATKNNKYDSYTEFIQCNP